MLGLICVSGCTTTSKCETVDREFQSVVSQREVEVVQNEPLFEAHIPLADVRRGLIAELKPALVASLPDPPESGFELQIEDAELSRPEDCEICYRLRGKLVGQAAADGVDIDITSGSIELVFEVGRSQYSAVFVPAEPASVALGKADRLRDSWRETFESALVDQLALIRPRPLVVELPETLPKTPARVVARETHLSLIISSDPDADAAHPEDSIWLNPRYVQRIVRSEIEMQGRVAAGPLVRQESQVIIPIRHFAEAPRCTIDKGQLVIDLQKREVFGRPEFLDEARARALLEALLALEPEALVKRPRRTGGTS